VGLTRSGGKAIRIALPEFAFSTPVGNGEQLAKVFNETLWNDLDFSGNIELAARSYYPIGVFVSPADIKVADWKAPLVNADYIAYGSLLLEGGRFTAIGRLRDLGAEQDLIASTFPGANNQEESARLVAHNFADRILEQLGLGRGLSRTKIAFVSDRTGTKEIFSMDYDGNGQQRLTAVQSIAITPNWSPVDDRIAYTAWRGNAQPRIEIVSSTGERTSFQQVTAVANTVPSWSPDGKSVVYASRRDGNTEIYWADATGANPRRLTHTASIDTSPVINPANGRQIAFVSSRSGTPQIYMMDSDGTNVVRITEEGGDAENPVFSPDGTMIAFAWQKPKSGAFDIHLYDRTTRRFTQLTFGEGNNERPTWAPDGKHIAFQSNRSGVTQIYAMTLDGKKVRQLTRSGRNEGPSWSGPAAR
jgi:TolB protein